jgi:hypothetical protein
MPGRLDDVRFRALTGVDELNLFRGLRYTLDDELEDDLHRGFRRPSWMWVALRGERVIARAAWSGAPAADVPSVFDFLDLDDVPDRVDVGLRLVTLALREILLARASPPDYVRFVAPDWRARPDTRRLVEDMMGIISQAGGQLVAERFRFEWRPGMPVPAPTGRLTFRPALEDDELSALMTEALDGTLDAHSRRDLSRMSARDVARPSSRGRVDDVRHAARVVADRMSR